jgi:hypothetical protein
MVSNPSSVAASLIPSSDTPSAVAKHRVAQPGFRDFPAMEITDHLKAGYAALHTVMLEIKRKSSAHFL